MWIPWYGWLTVLVAAAFTVCVLTGLVGSAVLWREGSWLNRRHDRRSGGPGTAGPHP